MEILDLDPTIANGEPLVFDPTMEAALREMFEWHARRFEESLARVRRFEDTPGPGKILNLARNALYLDEAGLADLIRAYYDPGTDDFEPYGVVVDGTAYILRFDPADFGAGIIARVRQELLFDLEEKAEPSQEPHAQLARGA